MQRKLFSIPILAALLLAGCSGASQEELDRLRAENERLRKQTAPEESGTPAAIEIEALPAFSSDPASGTLAGLVPGDNLTTARQRFGPEALTRSWRSEGDVVLQYEWELEPGLFIRLNANSVGRIQKVAVALAGNRPTNIPVFGGVAVGQDTFASLQRKYGTLLVTDLQFWGARGLYTITQTMNLAGTNYLAEFAFQLPEGLSPAQLNELGGRIQRTRDGMVLEPYLKDHTPFQVALMERKAPVELSNP